MARTVDLVFFVNGKKNTLTNPDPEVTLLQYLRSNLQLTGTKSGCGEGGCGACTVMISFWSADTDTVCHYSVNACLAPLCSLHGMAVTTVEGIGSHRTRLHPVQERIAAKHGTQCGFCTPGFVMSMYTLLRNNPVPSPEQLESAFEGNLCRCTGYRPILDAYRPFTQGGVCALGDDCCKNKASSNVCNENSVTDGIQNGDAGSCLPSQECFQINGCQNSDEAQNDVAKDRIQEAIFPPFLKLNGKDLNSESLMFAGPRVTWYRPVSLTELLDIKKKNPQCKLVVGNTEIGVEVKLKKQLYPMLVSTSRVPELTAVQHVQSGIRVGASVTLATLDHTLKKAVQDFPEEKTRVFSAFVEMLRWFSGNQIRNVATLGGNIMTASPISDLNPLLLACGATLELIGSDGSRREVKMDGSFIKGYRQTAVHPSEILLSVLIPFSHKNEIMYGYKQANRKEDDIAIVNAGMRVVIDDLAVVRDLTLAFGGMAKTTVMAANTMKQLIGQTWNEELLNRACDLLTSDLPLGPGSPGGNTEYRRSLTVSFFFKFYLTVLKQLQQQGLAMASTSTIKASDRLATETLERSPTHGLQWFEVSSEALSPDSALHRPVPHESAFKQATGEAVYVDDIAPVKGERFLALVQSKKARAKLVRVDTRSALSMPGVLDYISYQDIPAKKTWFVAAKEEDEIFASDEVIHQGQVIGAILADTMTNARRAAQAVEVHYDVMEPVITIADAIAKDSFFPYSHNVQYGDVEEAFSCSEEVEVVEGEVHTEAQEHFYLETQGTIVYPTEDCGMDIISCSQSLCLLQIAVAETLGISCNKVRCRTRRIGGAFGGKETRILMQALPAAIAAAKHNCPVRCVLERDEDMMMTGTRHPFLGKYKMGVDTDGKIVALDVQFYLNAGCSMDFSHAVAEKAVLEAEAVYRIPNVRLTSRLCRTNISSCTAFRGFGAPQATVVIETAIIQAAAQLGVTPEKIREANLYKDGDHTHSRMTMKDCTVQRCWDDVMIQSKFAQRRKEVDLFNSENRWRKRGIAVVPVKFGMAFTFECLNKGAALVNIYQDGTVLIAHGGVEMGQGLHVKVMQVASQALGIPLSKIQVAETSTNIVPNTTATAASVSSDLYGAAVLDACNILSERLKPIRAQHPKHSWEELILAALWERVHLSAVGFYKLPEGGCSLESGGQTFAYFTYGCGCSMVELDCLTGDHQVLSTDIVMDVGKSLNPAIDIGQIEGAFMQGYGMMMLEQYKVQTDGTLLTRGPSNYKIPSLGNIPQSFNVTLLRESGNPKAVYSSKGIGEPPLLLGASVLSAVHDAVRAARTDEGLNPFVTLDTPATPARIRMACSDRFTQLYEGEEKKSDKKPWFVSL